MNPHELHEFGRITQIKSKPYSKHSCNSCYIIIFAQHMTDHIYNYRDTDIGIYQVNDQYSLLLQVYPESVSYAVINQSKLIAWCEDCDHKILTEPGQTHEFLNYDYKDVVIALPSAGFTLVPNDLYDAGRVAAIARLLDVKQREKVFAQPLDDDNHIVFKVSEALTKKAEKFGLQNVAHMAKGWLKAIEANDPQNYNLYLNFDKNLVEIAWFSEGKLRFYNTFTFYNPDELVYYTGLVAKELQLQQRTTNIVVSGDINVDDKNAARLAEFFNGVDEQSLKLIDLPAEIFPHQVLSLTALSLCVSSEVL